MIVVLDSSNKSDSWIVQNFASFEVIARQLRKIMMGIWDHLRLPKVGSIRLASKVTKSPNVYKKLPKIARLISARNMNDFDQFWSQSNKPILVQCNYAMQKYGTQIGQNQSLELQDTIRVHYLVRQNWQCYSKNCLWHRFQEVLMLQSNMLHRARISSKFELTQKANIKSQLFWGQIQPTYLPTNLPTQVRRRDEN